MLNWIVWNRIVWSFNRVRTKDHLIELLALKSNKWKHLTVRKQMIKSKYNYSYKKEIKPFNCVQHLWALVCLKMLSINHIFNIYV